MFLSSAFVARHELWDSSYSRQRETAGKMDYSVVDRALAGYDVHLGAFMFSGFYKSEFSVDEKVGRSVTFIKNGVLLGGNSVFSHVGSYKDDGEEVRMDLTSRRHLNDKAQQSLLGADVSYINLMGSAEGCAYRFKGSSPQMPGAIIRSLVTPLNDGEMPQPGTVTEDGIPNGLYSIHFELLDGLTGGLSGVALLSDGQILGGDAYFFYLGSYSSSNGRWRGEILSQEHTLSHSQGFPFGRQEVGIGFSGVFGEGAAQLSAVALSGKQSVRLQAKLKLIEPAQKYTER